VLHDNVTFYDSAAGREWGAEKNVITLLLFSVGLWQLNMPKKKFSNKPGSGIGEEVCIAVNLSLKKFMRTEENKGKLLIGTTS
jgi:hypothetical protein